MQVAAAQEDHAETRRNRHAALFKLCAFEPLRL
jgi:hypothetical protein